MKSKILCVVLGMVFVCLLITHFLLLSMKAGHGRTIKAVEPQFPSCPSPEPGHIPSPEAMETMDENAIKDIYHNYGSNAEVLCQRMLRMGRMGDGGWEVCDDPHIRPSPNNCIVYSFGINYDFSFDDMIGDNYGCEVHSFDPSMKTNTSRRNKNVMFYRLGVHGENTKIFETWPVKVPGEVPTWPVNKLSKIREDLGHSQRHVDVMKMDIEHCEWPTLKTAVADGSLENVGQLLVELHGLLHYNKSMLIEQLTTLRSVRSLGFRIFYAHKNPPCAAKFESGTVKPPKTNCYEIHLMKIPSCAGFA